MSKLTDYTTAELEVEIKRRAEQSAFQRMQERERRAVVVDCPACGGLGKVQNYGLRVGTGEEDEYSTCRSCNGTQRFTAYRV